LYEWGLLTPERRLTCYAGCQTDFEANYVSQPIVQSGNLFTAAGAGLSIDFALAIVAHLANPQLSAQIRTDLQLG
ncbi:MAG: DJ-1/PfpI family protein, partial [Planctomycetaceae bacterium]|nr:DJ-1/PfpI family protein [Planctomycetaceae bacterium]